jgi:hypothetical protein
MPWSLRRDVLQHFAAIRTAKIITLDEFPFRTCRLGGDPSLSSSSSSVFDVKVANLLQILARDNEPPCAESWNNINEKAI